ncbi:hypothetical protein PGQ11_001778 [Apiospora arundinis]|uniref:Tat pathway signal sequence n=1 Tax=Apiospora arundinis TaxID=335852 RepID=A0ABR2JHI4_9PEZI
MSCARDASGISTTLHYSLKDPGILSSNKSDKKLDGNLFDIPHPSPYRNYLCPNATVESAWQSLEATRTFPITRDAVVKLGKDPATAVQYPSSYGPPYAGRYVAQLDLFHQLHCLNLLRHAAWSEHTHDGRTAKKSYSALHWVHIGHCVEVLRENLGCNANLDVITLNWKQTQDLPWQEDHALPVETSRNFTRPIVDGGDGEGAFREVPTSDEYFRIYGIDRKVDLHHGEAHEHSYTEDS